MLEVQQYLHTGRTLADLWTDYAVKSVISEDGRLVSLKYDQIKSGVNAITRQCRGLVLEVGTWEVVARPFDRFFNAGEGHAAPLTGGAVRAQEKVDGALAILYRYGGTWQVASSGTPTGMGAMEKGSPFTFRDAFWRVWGASGWKLPEDSEGGTAFLFELCVPENRAICRHDRPSLTLIGARDRDGTEHRPGEFSDRWAAVREFPLPDLAAVRESFRAMNPLRQEGYVLVTDGDPARPQAGFTRQKCKHPGYVALHHLQGQQLEGDTLDRARAVSIVRCGEISEVMAVYPRLAPALSDADRRFKALLADLEQERADLEPLKADRRAFALKAQSGRFPPVHFGMLTGKLSSFEEGLVQAPLEMLVKAMWGA